MNQFDELCKLASGEDWCWKLFCTTCGHMHFRYAFSELATGKSPVDSNWIVHGPNTRCLDSLGSLPRSYTDQQKEKIGNICLQADLASIASVCRFPDWLGYLGLVLEHMSSGAESYKKLSESWASQLSRLVSEDSQVHVRLAEIAEGKGLLNIKDLDACESDIMHSNGRQRTSAVS
jgi:hypothetical protein